MREAIRLSVEGMRKGAGGPFGAVVAKDGRIIGRGHNSVIAHNDPTAHAEVVAIREACAHLGSFQLEGCEFYTSCEPCPMCLGAIYWARPAVVYFANNRHDAAKIGFDDRLIYEEIGAELQDRRIPMRQFMTAEAAAAFGEWREMENKTEY